MKSAALLLFGVLLCSTAIALPLTKAPSEYEAVIPHKYPLFKQCDKRWGSDVIVTETLCKVGCLENSISSGLAGKGYKINGAKVNPGSLNSWLKSHHGYTSSNELIEGEIPHLHPSSISWTCSGCGLFSGRTSLSKEEIKHKVKEGLVVIGNVMNGAHFVLITGYDTSNANVFHVNDSGFDRSTYNYDDFVGYRVFKM
mmetsp:Transcript_6686/g.16768  ORF Transcript_6686/g.16768 Transcript_6686/m.16768 type:complete len:198 (+) Transcript_6686:120-713(+)